MTHFAGQLVNLFAAVLLLISFAMLSQRRIVTLINLFALQGAALVGSTVTVAYATGQKHLYYSAAITLVLKVIVLPWILHRLIRRLNVKWDIETLINIPMTMLVGIMLVVFSFNLALPISEFSQSIARGTLGIALACVLLSFLMMITRSKAVPQVIGFLSMEKRALLRRHQRDLRDADGGRAGNRARRPRRHGDPGRIHVPDPRAVRFARHPPSREAEGGLMEALLASSSSRCSAASFSGRSASARPRPRPIPSSASAR
jgi:hydrogenase-4 component E